MKMNEYSVLMPLYKKDNPEWFQYALNSILNQTKVPNEIVITCDGPLSEELENTLQMLTLFLAIFGATEIRFIVMNCIPGIWLVIWWIMKAMSALIVRWNW